MKRRSLLLSGGALAAGSMLSACGGGGSDSGSSFRFRLLNASPDYSALDLYVDSTSTLTSVAYGAASSYTSNSTTTLKISLATAGTSTYAITSSQVFSNGNDYTLLAYGWSGGLKLLSFVDSQAAASSGQTSFRVIHTASDAGTVDVYVTSESASLASSTPLVSGLSGGSISSYATLTAGTYRVRIVGTGNTSDLRLDISGVVLDSTGVVSLITVPGSGGVLMNALQAQQGGSVKALTSPLARVRVVASVAANASVRATVGTTEVLATVRSPTIGSYVAVPSGTSAVSVLVDGVAATVPSTAFASGSDSTIVVSGTAAAPVVSVVTDDNRLPKSTSTCKVRLLHAAQQLSASRLGLSVNYSAVASDVALGAASSYSDLSAGSSTLLEVQDPLTLSPAFSASGVTLVSGALYTVVMLTGNPSAGGVLRRER